MKHVPQIPPKYRSRTDIVAQILQAANDHSDGASKAQIMYYGVFLSYTQLKEYLTVLIQYGLLELSEGTPTYKTTEKGLKFLEIYEQIKQLVTGTAESRLLPEVQK